MSEHFKPVTLGTPTAGTKDVVRKLVKLSSGGTIAMNPPNQPSHSVIGYSVHPRNTRIPVQAFNHASRACAALLID